MRQSSLVVVANRLPLDDNAAPDGACEWRRSPGGLASALHAILQQTPAVEAAGAIHSDIQRGFIRAEIVAYDELVKAGGMNEAKKSGTVRLEGKQYIVKDGDVCHFLFNV